MILSNTRPSSHGSTLACGKAFICAAAFPVAPSLQLILPVLAMLCVVCPAHGSGAMQDPILPGSLRSAYENGSYEEVITLARRFLVDNPDSPARHEVRYLAGKASWELKRYSQVEDFLTPVVTEAESSPRWSQAALLLSLSLERRGEYFRTAEWLSRILAGRVQSKTRKEAEDLFEEIVKESLSPEELSYLAYRFQGASIHCWLLEKACEAERRARHWEELWNLVGLASRNCDDDWSEDWAEFAGAAAPHAPPGRCKDPYLVGLACPLEGPFAPFGESLRRGAVIGFDEYNARSRFKLGLAIVDTKGDPIDAVAAAGELALEQGVVCIIGGLLSSTTIAVAGVASGLEIPLVSPSATREEISRAGPAVFQSTLPRVLQVRALAETARVRLGADSAAVLFPETSDGEFIGGSFEKAFERAGGKVVYSSGYLEGETNFGGILSALSSKGPDCILLAGTGRDLTPLIPQLVYYDLDVPILALESIAAGKAAELAEKHLTDVLYCPGAYRLTGEGLGRFEEAFEGAYGSAPDDFAVKGYLAARFVTAAVSKGARSRGEVTARLEELLATEEALREHRFLSVEGFADVEIPVIRLTAAP